jgi:hypothetical protein
MMIGLTVSQPIALLTIVQDAQTLNIEMPQPAVLTFAVLGAQGIPGPSATPINGIAVITVPTGLEVTQTVVAVGVTSEMMIGTWLAPASDADENTPEMLDLSSLSAVAGTAEITITATFSSQTSGPVKIMWSVI